jgi:hypothetical protein
MQEQYPTSYACAILNKLSEYYLHMPVIVLLLWPVPQEQAEPLWRSEGEAKARARERERDDADGRWRRKQTRNLGWDDRTAELTNDLSFSSFHCLERCLAAH